MSGLGGGLGGRAEGPAHAEVVAAGKVLRERAREALQAGQALRRAREEPAGLGRPLLGLPRAPKHARGRREEAAGAPEAVVLLRVEKKKGVAWLNTDKTCEHNKSNTTNNKAGTNENKRRKAPEDATRSGKQAV